MLAVLLGPWLAACGGGGGLGATVQRGAFTSAEFGVAVSPRVTTNPNPPRGGGRQLLGRPYTVRGKVYTPSHQPDYVDQGTASWYGADFHGRRTANGEIFSANAITGAHPTLPLPSYVRVTNLDNGRSILVRINDRGPYMHGRIIDLSHRAAAILGYINKGVGNVQVNYVGPAPLNGDDTRMLLASVNKRTRMEQGTTRFAFAEGDQLGGTAATGTEEALGGTDLIGDVIGLFSYASTQDSSAILSAHDAANAMATRAGELEDWAQSVDEDARDIRLVLGTFSDPGEIDRIVLEFARLAAVDEEQVQSPGSGTRLTLSQLKPGVSRTDVLVLAQELGLAGLVLY